MVEIEIHVRDKKIVIKPKTDLTGNILLDPAEAMDLGVKLLRAAYALKDQEATNGV